jgi:hypothetical protein
LQASFAADGSSDINVDDPDFWQKWAAKANLDLEELANKVRRGEGGGGEWERSREKWRR